MDAPSPIRVELLPHDRAWANLARAEASALHDALGDVLLAVHHIGSTAIAGIRAKPIVDLIPVVRDLPALDARRAALESLGYRWWGELGLPGRRYCTRDEAATGNRLVQLHAYAEGTHEIARHLAFRDLLRQDAALADEYEREKQRCQLLHPEDSHAYAACKSGWIRTIETRALAAGTSPVPTE